MTAVGFGEPKMVEPDTMTLVPACGKPDIVKRYPAVDLNIACDCGSLHTGEPLTSRVEGIASPEARLDGHNKHHVSLSSRGRTVQGVPGERETEARTSP